MKQLKNEKPMTGKQLRAIRKELDMNQGEFARALGYRRWQTISEFENSLQVIPAIRANMARMLRAGMAPRD